MSQKDNRRYWRDPEKARREASLYFSLHHEARIVAQRERRQREPEKHRARNAVSRALRANKLIRQPCERCGDQKTEAHHNNYNEPLDVRWLCSRCHGEEHRGS